MSTAALTRVLRSGIAGWVGVSLATVAGCAHVKTGSDRVLVFPPVVIIAGNAQDRELAQLNPSELLAKGRAAFGAQDYATAAKCFTRGADFYPDSPLHGALSYNAGLALLQQHEWAQALERFKVLAEPKAGQGDALDAAFQEAACLYFLDDYAEAAELLTVLSERRDIPESERLSAQVDLGVCQVELDLYSQAEHSLREAVRSYQHDQVAERMPEEVASKGEFFLGEIYRIYFSAVKLDPATRSVEELGADLEQKAEELLSAQGHYLRAIRIGTPHWATAAGYRIGSLYEDLYDAMVAAPIPGDLDTEQADLYREELTKRIRVLVTKAINIYDQTLAAANRIGEDNPFVAQTHESLEHMKTLLLNEKVSSAESGAAPAQGTPGHVSAQADDHVAGRPSPESDGGHP
jgi:tetratricopeptide (TPR) repeat protein